MDRAYTTLHAVCLLGLLTTLPVSADTITVTLSPVSQTVAAGEIFDVAIVADIPALEAVVGWGLDFIFQSPELEQVGYDINSLMWNAAPTTVDGDGLAATVVTPPGDAVSGTNILLATIQLQALAESPEPLLLALSDDNPIDLTEGFARDPALGGGFATVSYVGGRVFIPEPATSMLVVLGLGLALARRGSV